MAVVLGGGYDPKDDNWYNSSWKSDHRTNIKHEHIGGMHESEALGHNDKCPDCAEDWRKRRMGY